MTSHNPAGCVLLTGIAALAASVIVLQTCRDGSRENQNSVPELDTVSIGESEYVVDGEELIAGPFEEIKTNNGKFYGIVESCQYELDSQGVVDADDLSALCQNKLEYY